MYQKAGATVTLTEIQNLNDDVRKIVLRVGFESSAGALESHLMDWISENEVYLENAEGQQVEPDAYEEWRPTENEIGVAYLFGQLEGEIGDYTLVYKTPAALVEKQISFQFRDVPLP